METFKQIIGKSASVLLVLATLIAAPFAYAHSSERFSGSSEETDQTRIRAVTDDGQTQLEIRRRLEFMSEADTEDELADEIASMLEMTAPEVDSVLELTSNPNQTFERDRFRLRVRIDDDHMVQVRFERRVTLNTTIKAEIVNRAVDELNLSHEDIMNAIDMRDVRRDNNGLSIDSSGRSDSRRDGRHDGHGNSGRGGSGRH